MSVVLAPRRAVDVPPGIFAVSDRGRRTGVLVPTRRAVDVRPVAAPAATASGIFARRDPLLRIPALRTSTRILAVDVAPVAAPAATASGILARRDPLLRIPALRTNKAERRA